MTESHNGKPPKYGYYEGSWTFGCRDWRIAADLGASGGEGL